jgi:hypothetical protein
VISSFTSRGISLCGAIRSAFASALSGRNGEYREQEVGVRC